MMKTIQFLLCASEETRQYLWSISIVYTLLVNQLIQEVITHKDFQKWLSTESISQKAVELLCQGLKKGGEFSGLPARIYTSAVLLVCFMFKSWFAIQKKRLQQLNGKRRWLKIMLDALELEQSMNFSSETIRARAARILEEIQTRPEAGTNNHSDPEELDEQSGTSQPSLMSSRLWLE